MAALTGSPARPAPRTDRPRTRPDRLRSDRLRAVVRIAAAVAVVVATAVAVGVGPFLRGVASVSVPAILLALVLAAVATGAAAWRWRIVAGRLGLPLRWRAAFGAYYRSQFLNTVLPGGIVGDVHRAYAHGREQGEVGTAARAVAAERVAGQLVQGVLTLAILVPLGFASALTPLAWSAGILVAVLIAIAAVLAAIARTRRALATQFGLLRPLLARPGPLVAVCAASIVVVAAHLGTFLVAGAAVGVPAGPRELVPLGLVVLSAAALPTSIGGWGPREAAGAGVFAVAGLGGAAGVAVSSAFGVLAMAAVAPGALVLLGDRWRARRGARRRDAETAAGRRDPA